MELVERQRIATEKQLDVEHARVAKVEQTIAAIGEKLASMTRSASVPRQDSEPPAKAMRLGGRSSSVEPVVQGEELNYQGGNARVAHLIVDELLIPFSLHRAASDFVRKHFPHMYGNGGALT